ncbi:CAP domain-containing protein [Nocardioides sp. W3-2-3]|uniref:CAP domain-containing protein n=1 Tax=Nocardioides convexus TaxID=2712224 RepID=UPI002418BA6D|nr:CAP domain-containing protein [Nocardioides convexus]NHA02135.1 CAP domain-containing protein [Nocardioides convexus]
MLARVNAERTSAGLSALRTLAAAQPLADQWAEHTKDGPYEHDTDPATGYDADLASLRCSDPLDGFPPGTSEAIHWGSEGTPAEIAARVVTWWMGSPNHRPILLEPSSTYAGVGLAYSTSSETWTVVLRTTTADCSNIAG